MPAKGGGLLKTILFDMDGVLVQTERMHFTALNAVLAQAVGRTMDWGYYAQFVGSTNAHTWQALARDFCLSDQLDGLKTAYTQEKVRILERDGHQPVAGAPELVRALWRRGYGMAVASSSPMEEITAAMQALGLTACFREIVSGEMAAHPKPAPDIFRLTAERLGVSPADCVVIEDSANGVRAAKAAGMACIGFRNPASGTPASCWMRCVTSCMRSTGCRSCKPTGSRCARSIRMMRKLSMRCAATQSCA